MALNESALGPGGAVQGVGIEGKRLGLGQVDAAVEEGPARELPRLGRAGAAAEQQVEQHTDRDRSPVTVNLHHVLPGVGAGCLHPDQQHLVQTATAARVDDLPIIKTVAIEATVS